MAKTRGLILTTLQSVARLTRTVSAKRLFEQGLYAGQDKIILALAQENGQTPGALAQKLRVKPPTITKTINRLAAQGFLEKRSSDQDARRTHIYLTPLGEEAIRQIENSLKKIEERALEGIEKEDLKTLKRILEQIAENLAAEQEKGSEKHGNVHDSSPVQNSRSA
ncbi:MarR family transcriptional regulator [Nitratireductor aestuarii]|uniref:MarR family transcriptional regulator n=1 Tax=Nitratireductor aestuarii TaxID=1735103 RepID=A0A916W4B0_9HYPH|nr:MarR family transcriptional regulator [Nitratireductor aestuarii]GGA64784.1 MarR family transcriptional regulator [Nitratireductor aestuarii]